MRTIRSAVLLLLAAALSGVAVSQAKAYERLTFDIAQQPLSAALRVFAEQAHVQILRRDEDVSLQTVIAPPIAGEFSTEEALGRLLSGSGIAYEFVNDRTVRLVGAGREGSVNSPPSEKRHLSARSSESAANTEKNAVAAAGTQGRARETEAAATEETSSGGRDQTTNREPLQEVLVTANRRQQRSQDVGSTLQVVSGSELDRNGANGFDDYLLQVPAVSFRDQGGGAKRVAVRGISNASGTDNGVAASVSTVGLYLNDVPVQGTSLMPDLSLYDLNRVEVLKGPQGTLYGEGAMGGAIKMILNSPDPTAFGGKADATFSDTEHGGANYRIRGAVNIPMSDRAAARLVGTYRDDSGFIDNIATGERHQNDSKAYSIRGLLDAGITDKLSAEVLLLYDSFSQGGVPQFDQSAGDLKLSVPTRQSSDVDSTIAGLTLKYDFAAATLTSVSSYFHQNGIQNVDVDFITSLLFGPFGASQAPVSFDYSLNSFAQELRLVSNSDRRLDWILGAFYREKKRPTVAAISVAQTQLAAVNAALAGAGLPSIPSDGVFFGIDYVDRYEQYAAYGEINFEITKKLELTAGLRGYNEDVTFDETDHGFGLASFLNFGKQPQRKNTDSGVVPKVGLSYKVTQDALLYALASKGFRSPVINVNKTLGWGDDGAEADKLWSYELGAKTTWADGRFMLNGSLFYVDWSDMQLLLPVDSSITPGSINGAYENGGDAEIRGVEVESSYMVRGRTLLGATFAYTDGDIVRSLTNTIGRVLPNSPKRTASAFVEQHFPIPVSNGDGYLRFDVSYTDKQAIRPYVTLPAYAGQNIYVDSYSVGNLHLGARLAGWGFELFADNLWDKRAELGRGLVGSNLNTFNQNIVTVSRPRSVGLSVNMSF